MPGIVDRLGLRFGGDQPGRGIKGWILDRDRLRRGRRENGAIVGWRDRKGGCLGHGDRLRLIVRLDELDFLNRAGGFCPGAADPLHHSVDGTGRGEPAWRQVVDGIRGADGLRAAWARSFRPCGGDGNAQGDSAGRAVKLEDFGHPAGESLGDLSHIQHPVDAVEVQNAIVEGDL